MGIFYTPQTWNFLNFLDLIFLNLYFLERAVITLPLQSFYWCKLRLPEWGIVDTIFLMLLFHFLGFSFCKFYFLIADITGPLFSNARLPRSLTFTYSALYHTISPPLTRCGHLLPISNQSTIDIYMIGNKICKMPAVL